jgi:EAL domain-containing protein (putative c-di-GMP-specific phosphodiesterase class I)
MSVYTAIRTPFECAGHQLTTDASIGIALAPEHGVDLNEILKNADLAMYAAKSAGRRTCRFFDPEMDAQARARRKLELDLRQAIARGELDVYYQPCISLQDGRITGCEALARWRHPERGMVSPAEFIPIAEETGLIVEIDRWVLREACRRFAEWWREAPLSVSVNTSMPDLQQPDFVAHVERAIDGGFPPSALVLEVTESARLEDAPGALASLHAVKELGVRVALDDFGTGYSSLLSLSQLPVDLLKIARPFLQALGPGEPKADGLLAGMVALGRHLGLMTVAEGIETTEQHELLVDLGCDLGQGYLLGRPLDADGASQLVHRAAVD